MASSLISRTSSSPKKDVYAKKEKKTEKKQKTKTKKKKKKKKKKEFVTMRNKFLPFRVDSFSEGEQSKSDRFISTERK